MPASPLAIEILAYLSARPAEQDTIDGIAGWWLSKRDIRVPLGVIKRKLDDLKSQRLVRLHEARGGHIFYRLHPPAGGRGSDDDSTGGRYQQLFDEALDRVPPESPQWTNFNQSDPGVSLIQLFAWLAESLLNRMDSIPEPPRLVVRKIAVRIRKQFGCVRVLMIGKRTKATLIPIQFVASKLGAQLYRVDLADVIGKYIGETENNLRRLLKAAGDSGVILFLDEADALLGKHSKVQEGHNRYANLDASYVFRRLKQFKGIAILGGSRSDVFEPAFLRHLTNRGSLCRARGGASAELGRSTGRRHEGASAK